MQLANLIQWYVVFIFSTCVHEGAHSWTSWKLGDDTAHRGGQVSLNPVPHIRREPMGMVVVPIVSYLAGGWMIGWASAPYNPAWALANPRRAGLMALAGPLSNFALVLLAGLAIHLGIAARVFEAPDYLGFMTMTRATGGGAGPVAAQLLSILFSLNLLLGTFNLLPIPPLDGASVLLLVVSRSMVSTVYGLIKHPTLRMVGLYVAWRYFGMLFHPVEIFAAHLLYPELIF